MLKKGKTYLFNSNDTSIIRWQIVEHFRNFSNVMNFNKINEKSHLFLTSLIFRQIQRRINWLVSVAFISQSSIIRIGVNWADSIRYWICLWSLKNSETCLCSFNLSLYIFFHLKMSNALWKNEGNLKTLLF